MARRWAIVIGVAAAGVMALGAQTALAGGPPDLQLSGNKKQDPIIPPGTDCKFPHVEDVRCGGCDRGSCAVKVKVSCGDEACTARGEGKLTKVKKDKLKPDSADLALGERTTLELELTKKTRQKAGKAVYEGKKVEAKVTVRARDAAGNEATAKRTIKLVK